MIRGVVDQTVIGKYDPLCTPAGTTQCVNIAFVIGVPLREQAFPVVKPVTADAFSRGIFFQRTAAPAQGSCLAFGNKVVRESAVLTDILRYLILVGIAFLWGRLGFRRLQRRLREKLPVSLNST